jgi:hypothetical protein
MGPAGMLVLQILALSRVELNCWQDQTDLHDGNTPAESVTADASVAQGL